MSVGLAVWSRVGLGVMRLLREACRSSQRWWLGMWCVMGVRRRAEAMMGVLGRKGYVEGRGGVMLSRVGVSMVGVI
jgi:hypothetical protein